jgi:type IV secretion system protein VirD4
MAPTRSGKGVSAIIPNLLTYPGAVLVIDPKGGNAAVTGRQRRDVGQAVYILDLWNIAGQASATFNPLDRLIPPALISARTRR